MKFMNLCSEVAKRWRTSVCVSLHYPKVNEYKLKPGETSTSKDLQDSHLCLVGFQKIYRSVTGKSELFPVGFDGAAARNDCWHQSRAVIHADFGTAAHFGAATHKVMVTEDPVVGSTSRSSRMLAEVVLKS